MRHLFVAALLSVVATAQTLTIPGGLHGIEANSSTAWPWARGGAPIRVQYLYDAIHFTGQNIAGPVMITRLRWRAQGGAVGGIGTYDDVTVRLATMPFDQAQASPTFANNLGSDAMIVAQGPVTTAPAVGITPGNHYVDIPLPVPFLYDPTRGDLAIDLAVGAGFHGVLPALTDARANTTMCMRVHALGDAHAAIGTVQANVGSVVEVTALRDALVPSFAVDQVSGASPLTCRFTDRSWSSDPHGILAWLWDFDSNGTIDSVDRHPTWSFGCGTHDVTLQVVDASHGLRMLRRERLIVTDPGSVTPSFTWQLVGRDTLRFLDTTTPAATAWAWDFDGDGLVDATEAAPVVAFAGGASPRHVTLSVQRHCRGPFVAVRRVVVADSLVTGTAGSVVLPAGATALVGLQVSASQGVDVLGVDVRPADAGAASVEMFVGPANAADGEPSVWRSLGVVATGAAMSGELRFARLPMPLHLEPGTWSFAIRALDAPLLATDVGGSHVVQGPGMALQQPRVRNGAFAGTSTPGMLWNGAVHMAANALTGAAGSGFAAAGCPGALGVPAWTTIALPVAGQIWQARLSQVAADGAFFALGLDRTAWSLGPLPWPWPQAPGCHLLVRPDDAHWSASIGGTVTFAVAIPTGTALHGLPVFVQGIAIEPAANAPGLVFGDLLAGRVGG
ncbi:MAG: hypothetical protein IPK26_28810 [Planctomycetes bacterium]|nr:hypothetical protein [Planctomycetota bacterium]